MKKICLLLFGLLPFYTQALVILQYHHISDDTPAITSTRPADFRAHLQLLEDEGMHIVDLKQALTQLEKGQALAPKSVAITFDDAYLSIYQNAWPELKQRQWPFTIFVNPQQIDHKVANMISWAQLKEMQDAGALIANHSQTHPYLIDYQDSATLSQYLDKEINAAEARLKQQLGTSHKLFAYPYGELSLAIMTWLKAQGYKGIGQHSGAVGIHTNMQAIPRYPAGGIYANPETLKTKLYTLAFPIDETQFVEPVLGAQNPPQLTLTFKLDDIHPRQLQCYSGMEGALPTKVSQTAEEINLSTQASNPITIGRDRYNCTAASKSQPGFYYWYSQYWINPQVTKR